MIPKYRNLSSPFLRAAETRRGSIVLYEHADLAQLNNFVDHILCTKCNLTEIFNNLPGNISINVNNRCQSRQFYQQHFYFLLNLLYILHLCLKSIAPSNNWKEPILIYLIVRFLLSTFTVLNVLIYAENKK